MEPQVLPARDYRLLQVAAKSLATSLLIFFISPNCAQTRVVSQKQIFEPIAPIHAPFPMPEIKLPDIPQKQFDVRNFGAEEGGKVKCTKAIQGAIDAAADDGGGIVVIPTGTWLTGAIHLENNTALNLDKGAILLFSQDPHDYLPVVLSRHEDIECYKYSSFIYAHNKRNIAITGEGTLNGQGKPWWDFKESKKDMEAMLNDMARRNVPVEQRLFDGTDGKELRPAFFQPVNCSNVLVQGVTFFYGAFWTITPTYCENVVVRKVHIVTEGEYGHTPNGDGVDPSSCSNVLIEDCTFDTGDDCIAIKAGRDADGLRVDKPTENVVVRHCQGLRGHGGIVIGSETSGGIKNIYAYDCQFKGTDRIVRIKTARGRGGVIENMWFKDITGEAINFEAIHLNMLYTGTRLPALPVSETTPTMRNIHFENITCTSGKGYAIELLGLPERQIENISFSGIRANTQRGLNVSDARAISIVKSNFTSATMPVLQFTDAADILADSVSFARVDDEMVRVDGSKSENIKFRKTNLSDTNNIVSFGPGVSRQTVRIEE